MFLVKNKSSEFSHFEFCIVRLLLTSLLLQNFCYILELHYKTFIVKKVISTLWKGFLQNKCDT